MRQLISRSSFISNIFQIFSLPPILLFSPLQFLPMIQNIPSCLVLGAILCICSRPSFTASITLSCSSLAAVPSLPLSVSLKFLPSLILLIISSSSSSCNLPCFLNLSALFQSCSIILICKVVRNFPFIHKSFNFTHDDNN